MLGGVAGDLATRLVGFYGSFVMEVKFKVGIAVVGTVLGGPEYHGEGMIISSDSL